MLNTVLFILSTLSKMPLEPKHIADQIAEHGGQGSFIWIGNFAQADCCEAAYFGFEFALCPYPFAIYATILTSDSQP